jgi:hypothetical protein
MDDQHQHLFIDDVPGDVKQDAAVELCMVDAVMLHLGRVLPHVNRLFIVSDRGGCFAGSALVPLMPFICAAHGFRLDFFLHNQEGDGKTALVRPGDWRFLSLLVHSTPTHPLPADCGLLHSHHGPHRTATLGSLQES